MENNQTKRKNLENEILEESFKVKDMDINKVEKLDEKLHNDTK